MYGVIEWLKLEHQILSSFTSRQRRPRSSTLLSQEMHDKKTKNVNN